MAELTERELRDKQRGLESLNARDLKSKQLQIQTMAIWRGDDRPSSIERFNAAKNKLDELSDTIETRKAEIELLKTQMLDIADKKAQEKRTKDITDKEKQLVIAQETRDTTREETLKREIETLREQQSGVTGGTVENEQYEGDNDFVKDVNAKGLRVTTDPETGGSWVSGTEGDAQEQQYIYIGPESKVPLFMKDKPGQIVNDYAPSTSDFDGVRKRIIEDAIKSPRGLKGLFDDLRGAGLRISQVDYDRLDTTSSSFGKALSYALQKHTKVMVNDLEFNKSNQPKSFFKYLQEDLKNTGVGDSETTYNEYVTKVDEAESDLNRFFIEYVGRGATDEEQKKYYKQLRALEKKNAQISTTKETDSGGTSQITTGEYRLDAEDILQLQRKIAGKALDGSDIDVILKGGSKAAQDVNNVLAYAKSYGVTLSNKDALRYVSNGLSNNEKIQKQLMQNYLLYLKLLILTYQMFYLKMLT
jgi:hypothetical protein